MWAEQGNVTYHQVCGGMYTLMVLMRIGKAMQ
jgi:hypothetical protein